MYYGDLQKPVRNDMSFMRVSKFEVKSEHHFNTPSQAQLTLSMQFL